MNQAFPENERTRQIDSLFSDAEEALSALSAPLEADPRAESAEREEPMTAVEIELGRIKLSDAEKEGLASGAILPLQKPLDGRVTLRQNGQACAEGILMVEKGKIAVRIISLGPFPDETVPLE